MQVIIRYFIIDGEFITEVLEPVFLQYDGEIMYSRHTLENQELDQVSLKKVVLNENI